MAYRMLRYKVRIWEDWFSRNPEAKALPMIIPIVMYHGQAPWSEPRLFGDVLAVPPSVRPAAEPYLVQFAYLLNDLSEISDDELRARAMTAVAKLVTLCLKHARTSTDFMGILSRWIDVVREVVQAPNGLSALAQVLVLHSPGQRARQARRIEGAAREQDRTRNRGSHRDLRTTSHRAGFPRGLPAG